MMRRSPPRWLLVLLVVAVACNLRAAVTSLAPFLDDVRDALGIGGTVAGLLTALPVVCFAVFGSVAPALARRGGARLVVGSALLCVAVGLTVRAAAGDAAVFFAASVLALGGMALGNVLVPALIRARFPDRIGPVTGLFTMALSLGATVAAAGTVPLAHALGHGWRVGLGAWGLVALAVALPWLACWPSGMRLAPPPAASAQRRPRMSSSITAWAIAVFFGTQALSAYVIMGWLPQIYRDAGLSAAQAGLLLALSAGLAVPIALVLPAIAVRRPHQGPLAVGLTALTGFGYAGLAVAPATVPWLWAALIGVGQACFPLAITLISTRARVAGNTAALSGFVQSVGYLIAAVGPTAAGVLYQLTHGWTLPLAVFGGFLVPEAVAGFLAGRPRYVEDDLGPARGGRGGAQDISPSPGRPAVAADPPSTATTVP
jgi:MFS transporter, CP family, cyanate transporter